MSPTDKTSLLQAIQQASQTAVAWYQAIPAEQFFVRSGDVWSASDNIDHLVRATRTITLALKLPKAGLQIIFGKNTASRSYEEICRIYEEAIARGGRAGGVYLPAQTNPSDPQKEKAACLAQLSKVNDALCAALTKWDDAQLDQSELPHPLIGKLTVREMLFFHTYHTLRHARPEGD